jgi:hypothetical protein
MSLKKLALLATALCALVAFAVPASASATGYHFTDNTKAIEGTEASVVLHGEMTFVNIFGSYKCEVTSEIDFNTHDATVTTFDPSTEECVGTGSLAGCELTSHQATVEGKPISENPATATIVDIETEDETTHEKQITIETELALHNEFTNCDIEELTLTFHALHGNPEYNGKYLVGVEFDEESPENEGITDLPPFELKTLAGGTLEATEADRETISID